MSAIWHDLECGSYAADLPLWRSLAATTGDLVVFLDSDLVDFDPGFVPALLGPLLTATGVQLVKGFYRRPLRLENSELETGGGRVTELTARTGGGPRIRQL